MEISYNHPRILSALRDPENVSIMANRPALGGMPDAQWAARLKRSLLSIAPPGLDAVTTMMCGSCSNENAIKEAMIAVRAEQRGGQDFSAEELSSVMLNKAPG